MSGRATVRLLLTFTFALATFTDCDCARPQEDNELSSAILRVLETSQQTSRLPLPQLSPADRVGSTFEMRRKPPAPIEEYNKRKRESLPENSEESPNTRSRVEFDGMAGQQLHRKYTYSSMLHRIPAGPNPIGNEYRPGNTMHHVKKLRHPPQG